VHRLRGTIAAVAVLAALFVPAATASAGGKCVKGFQCSTVSVPLDRSGAVPGTIDLPVAVERGEGPLMLALGGGPGQGMFANAEGVGRLLAPLTGHRIAVLDQRGTGSIALQCPEMQQAALTDVSVPPPGSVEACGAELGERRAFYSTTDTVLDLEAVRQALGEERMALLGISYGTYVAERYARAFPGNVSSLVLDSVVPQENVDPFFRANLKQSARVLQQLCKPRKSRCARATKDPVRDLRKLVKRTNAEPIDTTISAAGGGIEIRIDGPGLFDLILGLASFYQDDFARFPSAVKAALRGKPKSIVDMYAEYRERNVAGADELSMGLHTATLCADVRFPWGSPASDPATRAAALDAGTAEIPPDSLGPFDRTTAAGNGAMVTCSLWPATTVAPPPEPGPLPDVPTLVMAGTWDLSTPLADARTELARSPDAVFAKLPEAGHSALTSLACAQKTLARFYADKRIRKPCANNRAPRR
jgi:pimeloyl-ACP methyl ester carboxylesterase